MSSTIPGGTFIGIVARSGQRTRTRQGHTHRYEQYCSIARALDVIGDRWSLLVIRELMFTPKRYGDLLSGLTGVSSNLLAARLRRLEQRGVVQKRKLPPPAGSTVYELTERGRLLESVLYALSRFGVHYLGPPPKNLALDAEAWLYGMRVAFNPSAAAGVDETYEFRIDGALSQVRVHDGRFDAAPGPAADPAVVVTALPGILVALVAGRLSPAQAEKAGTLGLQGSRAAFSRFVSMFAMPAPEPTPKS